jgi:hypothetical protein
VISAAGLTLRSGHEFERVLLVAQARRAVSGV